MAEKWNEQNKIRLNWQKKQTTNQIREKKQTSNQHREKRFDWQLVLVPPFTALRGTNSTLQSDCPKFSSLIGRLLWLTARNSRRIVRAFWLVVCFFSRIWLVVCFFCQLSRLLCFDFFRAIWLVVCFFSQLSRILFFCHLSRILFTFLSQIHYDFRSKCVEFWDPRDSDYRTGVFGGIE